jgi:hypothetical protein
MAVQSRSGQDLLRWGLNSLCFSGSGDTCDHAEGTVWSRTGALKYRQRVNEVRLPAGGDELCALPGSYMA